MDIYQDGHKLIVELDAYMVTLKRRISYFKEELKQSKEENKRLKDEFAKDEEYAKLLELNKELTKILDHSFCISEDEQEAIRAWEKEHDKKHMRPGEKYRYTGASGGAYSYKFTPTSLGTVGRVICTCGESFVFQDL